MKTWCLWAGWTTRLSLLLITAFFLPSCTPCEQQWAFVDSGKCSPSCSSKKIFLSTENQFRGLTVEIIKTRSGTRGYLSILSLSFPEDAGQPGKTAIDVTVNDITTTFMAERLEGGQKILLPTEAVHFLISHCQAGRAVIITVGRYRSELTPQGFSQVYQNFHGK